jgi:hypothetical protein
MSALENRKYVMQCEYDFAKDGGAIGDITLRGDRLPAGAIVTGGVVHVQTAVTSAGSATVALELVGTADVLAATAKASLTLNALISPVPDGPTAGDWIRTTAATQLVATVAVAALTAGKIVVCLEYFITT